MFFLTANPVIFYSQKLVILTPEKMVDLSLAKSEQRARPRAHKVGAMAKGEIIGNGRTGQVCIVSGLLQTHADFHSRDRKSLRVPRLKEGSRRRIDGLNLSSLFSISSPPDAFHN